MLGEKLWVVSSLYFPDFFPKYVTGFIITTKKPTVTSALLTDTAFSSEGPRADLMGWPDVFFTKLACFSLRLHSKAKPGERAFPAASVCRSPQWAALLASWRSWNDSCDCSAPRASQAKRPLCTKALVLEPLQVTGSGSYPTPQHKRQGSCRSSSADAGD